MKRTRHPNNILRRLCQLHDLADEFGNRLHELEPEFASPANPYPWTYASWCEQIGQKTSASRRKQESAKAMAAGGGL
jgi:hypothetical protein